MAGANVDAKPKRAGGRSTRRRAREFAVQGLYEWLVAGTEVSLIERHLAEATGYEKIDTAWFIDLLRGTIKMQGELEAAIATHLDRAVAELSPVERGILLIGAFELAHKLEVPYRVIINESVELAKTFGGTDGHKYVNGVLDKLAQVVRAVEINRR